MTIGQTVSVEAKEVETQEETVIMRKKAVATPQPKAVVKEQNQDQDQELPKMPTYVVNLDRRPERWYKFTQNAKKIGLHNFKRFSGTDGKTLKWTPELEKLFPVNVSTEQKKYESHRRKPGVIGCAMSHYRLWKKMLAETKKDTDCWLVLEDDVNFEPNFVKEWPRIYKDIENNEEWNLLYLGYTDHQYYYGDPQVLRGVFKFKGDMNRKHGGGTFGYCLRRSGAKYLVDLMEKEGNFRAVDWFMIDQFGKMNCYLCLPVLVKSAPFHPVNNPDSDVFQATG
jgi:GR25 family glycosyltransferase involved in LPS biosynthesis